MDAPWIVIKDLEAHNSRTDKEKIIETQVKAKNDDFFAGVKLAYDPYITFGVKQVDTKKGDGKGLSWIGFKKLTDALSTRQLTGNDAQTAIAHARMNATEQQWNDWYRRILIKDMRAGFSEKTLNKVVEKFNAKEYIIDVFTCQLAHDSANHESKVAGEKLIEVKLDGVRVISIVYPSGHVDQYSRNGKELVNFPHIKEQLAKHAKWFAEPVILDGEIMSASFQDLMKQVHRKSNLQSTDAVLNLFDIITLAEFQSGRGQHRQIDRSVTLAAWYNEVSAHMPNVTIVGQELIDLRTEEGQVRFKQINADAVAGGYEGLLIKDPNAVYECKRSVAWLKKKPVISVDLKVIAVEEGTGKNAGVLGALVCEGNDHGKAIKVNVGSGLTDVQRKEMWNNQQDVIGQTVEILADAVTISQDSNIYSLRFPRFLRFRGFVAGEKL
jgi:DNA ligase-1